jgi:hypothetical protein
MPSSKPYEQTLEICDGVLEVTAFVQPGILEPWPALRQQIGQAATEIEAASKFRPVI